MPLDRTLGRYRAALCGSTLVMVALSWPLWVDESNFPRVPFLAEFPILPSWVSIVVLAGVLISLGLASFGRHWRSMVGISLGLLVFAVVQDQNRLQPWVYQYGVIGFGLSSLSSRRALNLARWYTISLYAYSGFSKLDASFCTELGPTFLEAFLQLVGQSAAGWPDWVRFLAVLAMPVGEIVVGGLLAFRATRRVGLFGSIVLHSALVLILGPWSLGHSGIVLVWNLAQVVENCSLFQPAEIPGEPEPERWYAWPARLVFAIAIVLPIGERWGLIDAWPAHALYASHAERSDVFIHEDDLDSFPPLIRSCLGPANATPWRRVDLTAWSRKLRGTPLYPSGRVGNAVAEFLESRFDATQPIRLVQWGRAGLWNNQRERDESLGLRAIRRRGERFWLNARPAVGQR